MNPNNPRFFENPKCADLDVNIFFEKDADDLDSRIADANYAEAKKICMSCQYQPQCAEWGIKHETHGMWGGLTPRERQKIRRLINRTDNTVLN